jgi:sulfite exporter TauE/SafE
VTGFLLAAALAGLVGSPHCVGMCGGFALACGGQAKGAMAWHAGRLVTYAVLGAVAGALGGAVPGPPWVGAALSATLIVWFAAALAGIVPEPKVVIPGLGKLASGLATQSAGLARFGFGLANGLLPCGLVYAGLSVPVASGDPLVGAAAMLAFGAGTIPALSILIFGGRRFGLGSIRSRRMLAVGVLIAGLWSVGVRQGLFGGAGGQGDSAHPGMGTESPTEQSPPDPAARPPVLP